MCDLDIFHYSRYFFCTFWIQINCSTANTAKKAHQILPFILCGPGPDYCRIALIFLKVGLWNGIMDPFLWVPVEGDEVHALDQPLQWWSCPCAALAWLLWMEKCVLQLFCHCSPFFATDTLASPWAFRKREEGATGISELLSSIRSQYWCAFHCYSPANSPCIRVSVRKLHHIIL